MSYRQKKSDIDKDRVLDFINSVYKDDEKYIDLREYAKKNYVPIISESVRDFLIVLIKIKKPKTILELGTAIGYSSLIMSECIDNHITTMENVDRRIIEAKENFKKYDKKDKINLIEGDISNVLIDFVKENKKFDFVFLDAAKGQYIKWLPYIKEVMNDGAILFSDNIFHNKDILESRYLIQKRDRTIHKNMREFIYSIVDDNGLLTKIINIGDGISISIKQNEE